MYQATQHIFLTPSDVSHQNLVRTDCIILHKLAGSSKQDITYVGIAVRTAFSIVNFSALERCLVDQFETLCLMRFTIVVNRSFFLLLKCSGKTKYFPDPFSLSIPKVSFTEFFYIDCFFIENVIEDLSLLIFCPEANSYSFRMPIRVSQLVGEV